MKKSIDLPNELFQRAIKEFAELQSAEYIICNIKTDSTAVLHEAHRMYISARIALNILWYDIRVALPQLPDVTMTIDWSKRAVFYDEEETP